MKDSETYRIYRMAGLMRAEEYPKVTRLHLLEC
jgi:hypothetical protein